MAREMPPWKVRLVTLGFLWVSGMCTYSLFSGLELYPFAPFTMYSSLYSGSMTVSEIVLMLKDGSEEPLVSMGTYDEARLGNLISSICSPSENPSQSSSHALREVLSYCLSENCSVFSRVRRLPIGEVAGLRAVRNFYRRIKSDNFRTPDSVRVCGETRL